MDKIFTLNLEPAGTGIVNLTEIQNAVNSQSGVPVAENGTLAVLGISLLFWSFAWFSDLVTGYSGTPLTTLGASKYRSNVVSLRLRNKSSKRKF